ncbi:MAG: DNA-binding protein [Bacteroidales bacterium]|nr:DNA-binding protein [Bacteroidales bacterium]
MKIIVDSNIVFSAILNSQGKIGQLIINGSRYFKFYTVGLLKEEIEEHKGKILSLSGFTNQQFKNSYQTITNRIIFVDEIFLSDRELLKAIDLVADIDENDALFVALTNYLNGKLWTGDKKLILGLKSKRYSKTISTNELYEQFLEKQMTVRRRFK